MPETDQIVINTGRYFGVNCWFKRFENSKFSVRKAKTWEIMTRSISL
jgi:hypothetical protein